MHNDCKSPFPSEHFRDRNHVANLRQERDALRAKIAVKDAVIEATTKALDRIHTRAVIKPDGDLLAQIAEIAEQALKGQFRLPKLVRDKCPTLFPENTYRIAAKEEMPCLLRDKLIEELHEYLASGEIEELADLVEVVNGILSARGVPNDDFIHLAVKKHLRKGGFTEGIVLVELHGDK
jgi:predicted house-cleaning noncanonical NTP pyrophosphatase (MazG superfamily)